MNCENTVSPRGYLTEKSDAYELKVLLPGIGKEDAELHIENHTLLLKTHAKRDVPEGFTLVAAEFEPVNYSMSFDLPELANPETLAATLTNGVLRVSFQKRPELQPRRIAIG